MDRLMKFGYDDTWDYRLIHTILLFLYNEEDSSGYGIKVKI